MQLARIGNDFPTPKKNYQSSFYKLKNTIMSETKPFAFIPENNIDQLNGYGAAMRALMERLKEMTGYKPENRMIDSVALLEAIGETSGEISKRLQECEKDLKSLMEAN